MEKIDFASDLLSWYHTHQRPLPWRENHDPYRIWLSEVMLQQTQVVTVIDYFNRFISAFPSVFDLAMAEEDAVFKLWEGLGYYSRAKNLMRCAKVLVSDFNGIFPNDLQATLKLPGIGPYTAGAILSIAYNAKVPAVDGNVMRVISRLYQLREDIANPKTRLLIEDQVKALLPEDCRHFNQALMELGATICTPKQAKCDICPVRQHCDAFKHHLVAELPIKISKLKKTRHIVPVAYIRCQDKILLIKRPPEGLLGGLWAFPCIETDEKATPHTDLTQCLSLWYEEHFGEALPSHPELLGEAKHVFTHKTWEMQLWHFEVSHMPEVDLPVNVWVTREAFSSLALPTAFIKLIKKSKSPR